MPPKPFTIEPQDWAEEQVPRGDVDRALGLLYAQLRDDLVLTGGLTHTPEQFLHAFEQALAEARQQRSSRHPETNGL